MVSTAPRICVPVLTDAVVREARRAVAGGETIRSVAARYDVNVATLGSAVRGKTYSWITDPPPMRARPYRRVRPAGDRTPAGRTTTITAADTVPDADVAALTAFAREMTAAGADVVEVASDLGVTRTLLCRWLGLPAPSYRRGSRAVRLTPEVVADLRRRATAGATIAELSRETGVPDRTLGAAVRGRTWAHVTDPPPVKGRTHAGASNPAARLTPEVVQAMRREVAGGASIVETAARHGVPESGAGQAIRGRSWSTLGGAVPVKQRYFTRTDRAPADRAALTRLAQAMIRDGCSCVDAADDLGVARTTMYSWLTRRR